MPSCRLSPLPAACGRHPSPDEERGRFRGAAGARGGRAACDGRPEMKAPGYEVRRMNPAERGLEGGSAGCVENGRIW